MTDSGTSNLYDAFSEWMKVWTPLGVSAPRQLSQSILPGWSLISVNEGNSAAPDTEQAVVAKASYGRQLGRIMDAVAVLIDANPTAHDPHDAFGEFRKLAKDINATKLKAAEARIARLSADLSMLKANAPKEYDRQKRAILATLKDDAVVSPKA